MPKKPKIVIHHNLLKDGYSGYVNNKGVIHVMSGDLQEELTKAHEIAHYKRLNKLTMRLYGYLWDGRWFVFLAISILTFLALGAGAVVEHVTGITYYFFPFAAIVFLVPCLIMFACYIHEEAVAEREARRVVGKILYRRRFGKR